METRIRLKNIQLFGWHGVADKEKKEGQKFEIDVEVLAPLRSAIETDDIRNTINYSNIYENVIKVFEEKKYNLIETLANNISISIKKKFKVKTCKVIIRKPYAPINGILDTVEVEVNDND